MAEITREKMLRKYRYLTNTTKTAKERRLPERELLCIVCNKPITLQDIDEENCEANVNKGNWIFFHRTCV